MSFKNWTWADKLWTEWYQIMLKLRLLRLDFHVEEMECEGEEKFVSLICEPKWIWQRKSNKVLD